MLLLQDCIFNIYGKKCSAKECVKKPLQSCLLFFGCLKLTLYLSQSKLKRCQGLIFKESINFKSVFELLI